MCKNYVLNGTAVVSKVAGGSHGHTEWPVTTENNSFDF